MLSVSTTKIKELVNKGETEKALGIIMDIEQKSAVKISDIVKLKELAREEQLLTIEFQILKSKVLRQRCLYEKAFNVCNYRSFSIPYLRDCLRLE